MNINKLLFSVLFSAVTLQAGSSQYIGVVFEGGYDWLTQERSVGSNVDVNPIVYAATLNLGIDSGEDLRTVIYLGLNYFDKDLYEYETLEGDGSTDQFLYRVGFDIVKTVSEKGSSVLPYMKGGMSYEFMPLDGYAQSWAQNIGLLVGFGAFLRSSDTLEWQLGGYYKYRMWGNYNLDTPTTKNVELSDHSLMLELGLNFHY